MAGRTRSRQPLTRLQAAEHASLAIQKGSLHSASPAVRSAPTPTCSAAVLATAAGQSTANMTATGTAAQAAQERVRTTRQAAMHVAQRASQGSHAIIGAEATQQQVPPAAATACSSRVVTRRQAAHKAAAAHEAVCSLSAAHADALVAPAATAAAVESGTAALANRVLTRSQAARPAAALQKTKLHGAKRQRSEQNLDFGGSHDEQGHDASASERPAKRGTNTRSISVQQLVSMVKAKHDSPIGAYLLAMLLDALVQAESLSDRYWCCAAAVAELGDTVPALLLHGVVAHQTALRHLLAALHSGHMAMAQQAMVLIGHIISGLAQPSAAATAAEVLLQALLEQQQHGLLQLLQAMHSNIKGICVVAGTVVSVVASAVTEQGGTAAGRALVDGMLAQQQQGLQLCLQALLESDVCLQAAHIIKCLAITGGGKLLAALLSPQQRRGLQLLLAALDSSSRRLAVSIQGATMLLVQAATPQQMQELLPHLLRAMQRHSSVGAGQLLVAISEAPAAQAALVQYTRVLMRLLHKQGPNQIHAACVCWHLVNTAAGAEAVALQNPSVLLQVLLQGGEAAILASGIISVMVAVTETGRHNMCWHVDELLLATQPQHSALVASMAMRSIGMIAAGSWEGSIAVLNRVTNVLAVMLRGQHADAAISAGSAVLTLLQSTTGMYTLSQEQHLDTLLKVLQQRGPAVTHAARSIAHITAAVPAARSMLAAADRLEVINSMQGIVRELILADREFLVDPTAAYAAMAPVFWCTSAAAACGVVPAFIPLLVEALQRSELTMPVFEAVTFMTTFREGLLSLAPHLPQIVRAVSFGSFASDKSLQDYTQQMQREVAAAAALLQRQHAEAETQMQHAGVQLAQAYSRYCRQPCRKQLQAAVTVWLQHMTGASDRAMQLRQQVAAATARHIRGG